MIVHHVIHVLIAVALTSALLDPKLARKTGQHTTDDLIDPPPPNNDNHYKQQMETLTRQVMLQQFYAEQRVRTEGQSGIKVLRQRKGGTKNYFTESHTGGSAAAIHDHSNNVRTVGMGEFTAVMNGVEFKTRHNDYRLFMPHRTSKEFHATEPIPFPDVPPEVAAKATVDEQIVEMREWFQAWRDQDKSVRDYTKHFKPLLCYLEGAWTKTDKKVDEPFSSDRHFVDAKTWQELHDKVGFTAYSGSKSIKENLSFLPTKIMNIVNDSIPEFAQWNYRVLCHPLKKDLPTNRLRVVEDLSSRMMQQKDIYRHLHSRAARFQLNSKDDSKFLDRPVGRALLDKLMEEIPGKDNYQGNLADEGLDAAVKNEDLTTKDVSKYHRWYKTESRDAMGTSNIHRGYNDDYMFAAMTTQPNVAGMTVKKCKKIKQKVRPFRKTVCDSLTQKWTYAIPLEIIYLTPLSSWNPYKLKYHGDSTWKSPSKAGGRNGRCEAKKEFNGTASKIYYNTPHEFYTGRNVDRTSADTVRNAACVLDQDGVQRKVRASGVHVFLPTISGVGVLRQRYPIFPVHGEGSSVWKELNALRDVVMDMSNQQSMLWNYNTVGMKRSTNETEMKMSASSSSKTTEHTHLVSLTTDQMSQCRGGRTITVTTSLANGHQHDLEIKYNSKQDKFFYKKCDNRRRCWDGHNPVIDVLL